jgi:hypothetical protein
VWLNRAKHLRAAAGEPRLVSSATIRRNATHLVAERRPILLIAERFERYHETLPRDHETLPREMCLAPLLSMSSAPRLKPHSDPTIARVLR